jgi:hypothetical protein
MLKSDLSEKSWKTSTDDYCISAKGRGRNGGYRNEAQEEREAKDPRKGSVLDSGKGVCADPVNGGAILGKGGPGPQGGDKERQLDPDKGRRKT